MIDHPYVISKMIRTTALLAVLLTQTVALPSVCVADHYNVYLLAGQSNMDGRGFVSELSEAQAKPVEDVIVFYRNEKGSSKGWQTLVPGFSVPPKYKGEFPSPTFGPEMAFARTMLQANPDQKLALIKGSQGGTSMRADWKPGTHGETESQGAQYRDFIKTIQSATKQLSERGDSFTIRGLLWHQGESDRKSSTPVYGRRLKNLIARLREDVGVPDLPVVVGEVFDNGQRDSVRAAIQAVAAESSTVGLVSSAGTTTSDPGTHFDTKSQLLLGQRYANVMIKLPTPNSMKLPTPSGQSTVDRPNVLFISVDDLNDWQGALGGHRQVQTPHLDRLFQQGLLFTNAHCSQAVCTASRNSLLSGIHPASSGWYSSTKAMRRTYDEVMGDHVMLPQYFRDNGYRTLTAGKVFHQGASDYPEHTDHFWDEIAPSYKVPGHLRERGDGYGGTKFYPFPKNGPQMSRHFGKEYEDGNSLAWGALDREDMPGGKMYDELIADWAADRLGEQHEKPFFLAVGFVRPHAPFTAPKEFFQMYDLEEIDVPNVPKNDMSDIPLMGKSIAFGRLKGGDHHAVVSLSDNYWRELVFGYLACVSFVDAQVGKVIEALEESEYSDNTIVVLWSDHGQHLGEKRHWRKQSLWEESTRVPLYFKAPGVTSAGETCSQVVSLLDVYPTLVDLCKLPPASRLEGESLVPQLGNPSVVREKPILSSWYYGNHAVRSNDWRYIRYRDGGEELYDHRSDAGEHNNLAGDPNFTDVIEEHARWLPKSDVLPAGTTVWTGDKLDRRIREWKENDSVPAWLR